MSILKRSSKRKCSLRITYTNVYLKGAHLFVKCHVISVWHRKVPLRCLVNCFGLWLNSSLKWTFLCHIAFVEVEYYFLLFPHGWLRFTHRSLPNLPLHASSFIIIINLFFSHDGIQRKRNSFYRFCKYLESGFVNSNPVFFLCLLYRSWWKNCQTYA